jgi:hypothetical protein
MVRATGRGAVVHGGGGTRELTDGRVEGVDPLTRFGPTAADGLRHVDAMTECGDIVIVSMFDPESGEVAPFEGQIGSHGGVGGTQSDAFILHPTEWGIDAPLVGAVALHKQIRRWLRPAG